MNVINAHSSSPSFSSYLKFLHEVDAQQSNLITYRIPIEVDPKHVSFYLASNANFSNEDVTTL